MEAKNQTKNKSKGHTKRKRHKCIVPINYIQEKTGQQQTRGRKRKRRKWQITNRDVETAVNTEEEEETKSRQAQKGEEARLRHENWGRHHQREQRSGDDRGWQNVRREMNCLTSQMEKQNIFSFLGRYLKAADGEQDSLNGQLCKYSPHPAPINRPERTEVTSKEPRCYPKHRQEPLLMSH